MSRECEPNFDRVAGIYQWAEYLAMGRTLQRIRTHFLPALANRKQALLLGDGDGRFLVELFRFNQGLFATATDSSKRMLNLLQNRCAFASSRLCVFHGSALTFTPKPETDLIVSHFFLDCLTQPQLDELARGISNHCHKGTVWLVSDFQVPQRRSLRLLGKLYIRFLYAAFGLLANLRARELPDISGALTAANFHCVTRYESLGGLLYTELWELGSGRDDPYFAILPLPRTPSS